MKKGLYEDDHELLVKKMGMDLVSIEHSH